MDSNSEGSGASVQCGQSPRLLPIPAAATAYRLVYQRIETLLHDRADVAELVVPACPAWTVQQTVAHVTGVAQDVISRNLEGVGSESWTQAQIDRLGHHSIDELLGLWGQSMDLLPAQLVGKGTSELEAGQLVFDVLTHEHDIRGAVGEPGPRDSDLSYEVALGFLTTMYDLVLRHTGTAAMRLTTPSIGTVQLGDPDTATDRLVIDISDFDALRAFGGRRSMRQLRTLPWSSDPPSLPPVAGNHAIRPPDDDLVE